MEIRKEFMDCKINVSTAGLTEILKNAKDIKNFLQENESAITDPTLGEHLKKLLSSKALKRQEVIKNADLDSNYINQLFNGIKTNPSRNRVLSLAFGFRLNTEETERLLKIAKVGALYPKNKRDAILLHSIENGRSIRETNEVLNDLQLGTLSERAK